MELACNGLQPEAVGRSIRPQLNCMIREVFFTGTAVQVAPIVQVDNSPVGTAKIGTVTVKLRSLYEDATHGCMPALAGVPVGGWKVA